MIVDTHCHLDDDRFDEDIRDIIERAKEAGVGKIVIPGADMADLPKARDLSHKFEDVYFAVGVHPYHCNDFCIDRLREFARDDKCVAVGECGFDYYHLKDDFSSEDEQKAQKDLQRDVFLAQIMLAIELKKPLIVHIRDANEDSFNILKEYGESLVGGVLHCYNASRLLLGLKEFGFYYGIGGVITFKNAKALVQILGEIPPDRLLIETDAPYLTPEPYRGKRNEPGYTKFVVQKVAELLGLSATEISNLTTQNAKRLFGI